MAWYPDRIPDFLSNHFNGLTWHKDRSKPIVYLTFDDGPTPTVTKFVLDTLDHYNFKGSFFCIGDCVTSYPELFKKIQIKGHTIGNHTFNHLNAWKTNSLKYVNNIEEASRIIPSSLFRPPYGKTTPQLSKIIKSMGYEIVMWDVLSGDFDASRNANSCLKNLIKNTENGSIVVFHDSHKAQRKLKKILPAYCEYLKNNGFSSMAL